MASFLELIKGDQPVLVDFYATWCGPCKAMAPILQEFARRNEGKVKVLKVDIDKSRKAAMQYRIQGVPTLILFDKGQIKWRQSGTLPLVQLEKAVQKILG
ncbi:thioredoxin [Tellurirhabdus bombi]|uniref:thioredoxin n=1 Tax=Tellurirhabdus bombi TaxID=2907205 RepID=UPI001F029BE3|nr:thioredoxin [Tellurirhabdus bombi]